LPLQKINARLPKWLLAIWLLKKFINIKKVKFYKNCTPNIAAIFKVPSEYEIADDRAIFHWLSHIFLQQTGYRVPNSV